MNRKEKYCGYDVEIDDYIIDFNRLRKTTFNQIKKAYPTLGELTRDNYKEVYEQGYRNVLNMALNIITNNNIIDYSVEKLDSIIRDNFYMEFEQVNRKFQAKLKIYDDKIRYKEQQRSNAMRNNNNNNNASMGLY